MVIEVAVNNLIWIDEAFSKDSVDQLEAACCLTDGQNRVYFGNKVTSSFVDYDMHPNLRRNYRVIQTWGLRGYCLLEFIDKAISKRLQNFRRELLLEKGEDIFLNMSPDDQGKFISNYFYIYRELELTIKNNTFGSKPNLELSEKTYQWVPHAIDIYKELRPKNEDLSIEDISKLIHAEMKKKFLAGDEKMAKRGGKDVPSADSIARHALQNLR